MFWLIVDLLIAGIGVTLLLAGFLKRFLKKEHPDRKHALAALYKLQTVTLICDAGNVDIEYDSVNHQFTSTFGDAQTAEDALLQVERETNVREYHYPKQ